MKGNRKSTNFKVPVNVNRQQRKKERGFGQLAFKGKMTEKEWCQSKDPLFQVKGLKRWLLINKK
jgi:hypothetical protein